ncbi:biotin/lipoyl-containing protein [Sphingomonas montanisoli]|uniref:Biotin/lipoyl-binding protein n=1 Tax=Sphingomonas montanisoli TaxID=2606412 RepID=A0A5D9CFI8_9SPHN|nr:lipoyl domain-containing protein [Sphingomonas montanisoli]TZG28901.1 biotin/lipoyl-binding protein [Sphingomonas montanisoli]
MSTEVVLPKLGFSMQAGTVTEWLIADGAEVKEGEPLFLLEADKATNEVEAPASGKLTIIAATGEELDVGTVIGRID